MRRILVLMALITLGGLSACSEEAPIAGPEPASEVAGEGLVPAGLGILSRAWPGTPCTAAPYRQFDFWAGEWEVDSDGVPQGTNVVRVDLDGCLVEESWTGVDGTRGRSLNSYDPRTGTWNQYWIDDFAQHLRLSGGLNGAGQMVLSGDRKALSGVPITDTVTWTPLAGGEVNQFWEILVHVASPFTITAFDGDYHPSPGVTPAPYVPQANCVDPEFDAFDFLIGEWRIEGVNGLELATSVVEEDLSDCLIAEDVATPKGYASRSFRGYDHREDAWYQVIVDTEGRRTLLKGGPAGSSLVLEGEAAGPGGKTVGLRITTTPDGPDRATQLWETEKKNGSWKTELEVVYVRE